MKKPMQDISAGRFTQGRANLRRYHQARWDEPVLFELSQPGERGILVPELESAITQEVPDAMAPLAPT